MVIIPMTYQTEGGVLIGELTNEMWITMKGTTFWKNTLTNVGVAGLTPYKGSEKIELEDAHYNELTARYFQTMRKPRL
jgi:hypothetical protein